MEIAARLLVDLIVEGGVRKSGDSVRITVRLVDVAAGDQRWSGRYDRRLVDVFDVQEQVAAPSRARSRSS